MRPAGRIRRRRSSDHNRRGRVSSTPVDVEKRKFVTRPSLDDRDSVTSAPRMVAAASSRSQSIASSSTRASWRRASAIAAGPPPETVRTASTRACVLVTRRLVGKLGRVSSTKLVHPIRVMRVGFSSGEVMWQVTWENERARGSSQS